VRQFCRELSPTLLRAAAALGGYDTGGTGVSSSSGAFDYCELGSGMGDTLCTLAAAYPRGRFVGVDINPEHVAFARVMAQRGGLHNVRFLEQDLEELAGLAPHHGSDRDDALPDLDFVGAHGLLSWVSPGKRRAAIALAAARLRPGGLLYVSYNALPGWAAVQPLRRLLHELGGEGGTLTERATRALAAARRLRDQGTKYFTDNPAASEMLDTMDRVGPAYVVHEYFHEHWQPMHFADLAGEMATAGLSFCGELPLYRNLPRLTLPASTAELVQRGGEHGDGRLAFETLKDFATNVFFRGDLYIKNAAPSSSALQRYIESTHFGTLVTPDRLHREVKLPNAAMQLYGEPFDTLFALAAEGPVTLADLRRALPRFAPERLREAIVDTLASEQIVPMAPPEPASDAGGASGDAYTYNLSVLAEPLSLAHPVVLAAPRAGTGLALPALQAVCLRLIHLVPPEEHRAWIRAWVDKQPVRLHVLDRLVTDKNEQAQILMSELEKFRVQRLAKFRALGVVRA
jgi:SAM-dependent methyltransferase